MLAAVTRQRKAQERMNQPIKQNNVNQGCPSPKFRPPVISTGYGIAIHRQSAIALAHDRHVCASGGCDLPNLPQSSQAASRKPRSSPATRGIETKASQTEAL